MWSSTVTITMALLKLCFLVWCQQGHRDNTRTLDNQGVCVREKERIYLALSITVLFLSVCFPVPNIDSLFQLTVFLLPHTEQELSRKK